MKPSGVNGALNYPKFRKTSRVILPTNHMGIAFYNRTLKQHSVRFFFKHLREVGTMVLRVEGWDYGVMGGVW